MQKGKTYYLASQSLDRWLWLVEAARLEVPEEAYEWIGN